MAQPVRYRVENLQVVNRALREVDADFRKESRRELRSIGQLVEHDAEQLARVTIPGLARSTGRKSKSWAEMRTGVRTKVVYVVPSQKGVRGRSRRSRPNFAPLLKRRAMVPALVRNTPEVVRRYRALCDRICAEFNRG